MRVILKSLILLVLGTIVVFLGFCVVKYYNAFYDSIAIIWLYFFILPIVIVAIITLFYITYSIFGGINDSFCKFLFHVYKNCKCKFCGENRESDHDWNGCTCQTCGKCRDSDHDWHNCKCQKCNKWRNENHDWDNGCVCVICGEKKDEEHDWNGCKCQKCGKTRDEEHDWDNGCVCIKCRKKRDEKHDWDNGCVCIKCRKKRDEKHKWNNTACECIKCGATNHSWSDEYVSCHYCDGSGIIHDVWSNDNTEITYPCVCSSGDARWRRCEKCGKEDI